MNATSERAATASVTVDARALAVFVSALFQVLGAPRKHGDLVAEALVAADIDGLESHGVMLVPLYVERIQGRSLVPQAEGVVLADRGSVLVLDAENGFGQVSARRAAAIVAERSAATGLAAVAVCRGFHFGAAGYWAREIADHGKIGIVLCNTRPMMPPTGGAEPVVGNNPIALAFPTNDRPLVIDMAMSASAMGKIRLAAAEGTTIPEGWAADREGRPTRDPRAAISGMLLPVGGAKGFGLALAIDLLCGGLSGSGVGDAVRPLYGDAAQPYNSSHFFLAIEVAQFQPLETFAETVTELRARVRATRPVGRASVRAPGDLAMQMRAAARENCRLAASTAVALRQLAERLGVACPVPAP